MSSEAASPEGGSATGRHGGAQRPFLEVRGLAKRFAGATEPVFDGVNFTMAKGEFVCIVGHSGCGKTTILNVLAGLEQASDGTVIMDNREIAGPSLDRGVVFQGHALMPWLSVRGNIAFAVRSRWPDWSGAQVQAQVEKFVAMVGLAGAIDKKPQPALRRHEAARGHRPGLCDPAQDAAAGRALRRTRRPYPRHHPGRAAEDLRADAPDGVHDHARRRRSHPAGRHRAADEQRPQARIAEIVRNPLPRSRQRASLHHEPLFYPVRNHLVDFLVSRSSTLSHGKAPETPIEVRPGLDVPPATAPATHLRPRAA